MTPAINKLKKQKMTYKIHEYLHDASSHSYGLEAAEKLNVAKEQVFKTLVVQLDNADLAVAIIPVNAKLNMKKMAKATATKKAVMADSHLVERSTGYVLGGVSPIGQKKQLITVIDCAADHYATIFVSAGRRGLEIELSPLDLKQLTRAQMHQLSAD